MIPTTEELDRIGCAASGFHPSVFGENSQMHAHLSAIRDAVVASCRPQLRPIAEMPAKVPEGCVRLYGRIYGHRWAMDDDKSETDTHYIDIALPADTYPTEFEAAWEQHGKPKPKSAAFALWKGGER
jgi:hypothetical protein